MQFSDISKKDMFNLLYKLHTFRGQKNSSVSVVTKPRAEITRNFSSILDKGNRFSTSRICPDQPWSHLPSTTASGTLPAQ